MIDTKYKVGQTVYHKEYGKGQVDQISVGKQINGEQAFIYSVGFDRAGGIFGEAELSWFEFDSKKAQLPDRVNPRYQVGDYLFVNNVLRIVYHHFIKEPHDDLTYQLRNPLDGSMITEKGSNLGLVIAREIAESYIESHSEVKKLKQQVINQDNAIVKLGCQIGTLQDSNKELLKKQLATEKDLAAATHSAVKAQARVEQLERIAAEQCNLMPIHIGYESFIVPTKIGSMIAGALDKVKKENHGTKLHLEDLEKEITRLHNEYGRMIPNLSGGFSAMPSYKIYCGELEGKLKQAEARIKDLVAQANKEYDGERVIKNLRKRLRKLVDEAIEQNARHTHAIKALGIKEDQIRNLKTALSMRESQDPVDMFVATAAKNEIDLLSATIRENAATIKSLRELIAEHERVIKKLKENIKRLRDANYGEYSKFGKDLALARAELQGVQARYDELVKSHQNVIHANQTLHNLILDFISGKQNMAGLASAVDRVLLLYVAK